MLDSGLLLVDKPAGFTSHDVVAKVRKALGTKKVGHAGTLDPMATGLLVIGVNSATKLLTFAVGLEKTYSATIRLGESRVTDDAEGEITFKAEQEILSGITDQTIYQQIAKLTGKISQIPSAVSAIKVNGVRSYDRVRAGEQFQLAAREVTIFKFDCLAIRRTEEFIDLDVLVNCSSGTYIRALARDLGAALSVGGHLTALRRTRVGQFFVDQAVSPEQLALKSNQLIPLAQAGELLMPTVKITAAEALMLRQGKQIEGSIEQISGAVCSAELVAIVEPAKLGKLKSLVVFSGGAHD